MVQRKPKLSSNVSGDRSATGTADVDKHDLTCMSKSGRSVLADLPGCNHIAGNLVEAKHLLVNHPRCCSRGLGWLPWHWTTVLA
jgi:hypothetical protein